MEEKFSTRFTVRWSDLDSNGHMANIAYMEYAIQSRLLCFQAYGFSPKALQDSMIGPAVFCDEARYYKELRLLDEFIVTFHVSDVSDDGVRFTLKHDILRASDQQKSAHIITQGAWFDLRIRKLAPPPLELQQIMRSLLIPDAG
jgi:acyl-CoA thioester hydrolase